MNKMMLKKRYMMYAPKKKSRLPSGFQEVEYIQGTGTQCIDTGLIPTKANQFELDFSLQEKVNTRLYGMFGGYAFGLNGANTFWGCGGDLTLGDIFTLNERYILKQDTRTNQATLNIETYNGVNIGNWSQRYSSMSTDVNVYILDMKVSWSATFAPAKAKVYGCKIHNGDTLVRDFIPCYRKSDNEIGLYDIVNNQFYTNSGSGKFLMGRPLVYDTIQGYQQVDYIEKQYSASNSSYFNSGIPASNDLVVEAELFNEIGTTDGSCAVFGSRIGFKNKDYTLNFANAVSNGTKYDSRFGSNAYNYGSYLVEYPNNYHILTWGNGALKINGETKLTMTNDSFESTLNVYLFAGNSNGSVGFYEGSGKTKVKWLKMTKNGVLVRNFIPMKRTSNNEIGMYDLVTNTFFTNQGTGSFIAGREIINIDGYRQVEYIAGNNAYIEFPYVTNGYNIGFDISFDVPRTSLTQDTPIIQNDWASNWVPLGMSLTNKNKTYFGSYDMSNIPYWTNDTYTYNEDRYLINYKNSNVISSIGKSNWSHTLNKSLNDVAITNFTFMSTGVPSTFHLKSLDMTDGDNIVAKFIPMEETSTGLVGLYDLVGKKFYSSQTNSNFIKGGYVV